MQNQSNLLSKSWLQSQLQEQSSIKSLQTQVDALQKQVKSLNYNTTSLLMASRHSSYTHGLEQMAFLLRIAKIKSLLTRDNKDMLIALKKTKNIITNLNSPALLLLSNTVNSDIKSIKSQKYHGNIAKVITSLDHLNKEIQAAKLNVQPSLPKQAKQPADTTPSTWHEKITSILHGFKDLIIIRRHNTSIKPLLSSSSFNILKSNLSVKITQSQWALLSDNYLLYQNNLTLIAQQIRSSFPTKNQNKQILRLITSLKNQAPNKMPPPIRSLNIINSLLNQPIKEPSTKTKSTPKKAVKIKLENHKDL